MSISYDQASAAARGYLKANPLPYPEYRYVLTVGRAVSDGWFFLFDFERVDGRPLGEKDELGGAPGFIVSLDDGKVRVVNWKEWSDRQLGTG